MDDYIHQVYTTPRHPASYSSPHKLYTWLSKHGEYKPTKAYIKKWLQGSETYALHRDVKRKFSRNKIQMSGMDEMWDTDLADMVRVSSHNDSYRYLLVCIDVFSRYAWVQPLKTKKPADVIEAFKVIIDGGRKPKLCRSDRGTEYTAKRVENFFKDNNILHTVTQTTETKANYSERLIRTLKSRIYRYFTQNNTYRYIDKLQDFVYSYNNTTHRSIRMAPSSVNKENEKQVWFSQYAEPLLLKQDKIEKPKFKTGDLVRITQIKTVFARDFYQKWTGEMFRVTSIVYTNRLPMYKLKDYAGEEIKGLFYANELQKADIDETEPYKIEKILKTRGRGSRKEYFVLWKYWPKKYASWVPASDVQDI
jgi:hypothetical protein